MHIIFESALMLSKSADACQNYTLQSLLFFRHSVYASTFNLKITKLITKIQNNASCFWLERILQQLLHSLMINAIFHWLPTKFPDFPWHSLSSSIPWSTASMYKEIPSRQPMSSQNTQHWTTVILSQELNTVLQDVHYIQYLLLTEVILTNHVCKTST